MAKSKHVVTEPILVRQYGDDASMLEIVKCLNWTADGGLGIRILCQGGYFLTSELRRSWRGTLLSAMDILDVAFSKVWKTRHTKTGDLESRMRKLLSKTGK